MSDIFKAYPTRDVLEGVAVNRPPVGTGTFGWIAQTAGYLDYSDVNQLANVKSTQGRFLDGGWVRGESDYVNTKPDTAVAVGNHAVVYYSGLDYGQNHVLQGLAWAYDASPGRGSGSIVIESPSGVPIFGPFAVTQSGPDSVEFEKGFYGTENSDMLIRLANAGPGISGTVTVIGHKIR